MMRNLADLNLPPLPDGYYWNIYNEVYYVVPRTYVSIRKKRNKIFSRDKEILRSSFYITSDGTPAFEYLDGSTQKEAIENRAKEVYDRFMFGRKPLTEDYTGKYITTKIEN